MSVTAYRPPWLDADLDLARLRSDGQYRAAKLALYESNPRRWSWYLTPHTHTCPACGTILSHTGFEATVHPDSHQCCGRDVRERLTAA